MKENCRLCYFCESGECRYNECFYDHREKVEWTRTYKERNVQRNGKKYEYDPKTGLITK
jgi:hypothetical protein